MVKKAFDEILNGLNHAQRKAVSCIDGPVMVIAGPGTGKTQMLAARIGNILTETDIRPRNILCLTYTEAGTVAMKNRLATFMGQDAWQVHIHTFHGFCNRVISENPEIFGKQGLRVMDDLEKEELLLELLQNHVPAGNPLRVYSEDARYQQQALKTLFGIMQQEDLTAEAIHKYMEDLLRGLPENEDYIYKRNSGKNKKGDLNEGKVKSLTEALDKLRTATNLFDTYNQLKRERGLYEYDDMQRWVVEVFDSKPEILLRYQEQFHYFLVDEYQDTSGIQNHILTQLCSYWEIPNVFVVGDDDQSIYRFQGASVNNIYDFAQRYDKHLQTIVPETNYRSTQAILDAAEALIVLNKVRMVNLQEGLNKHLNAHQPHADAEPPCLVQLPNPLHEAIHIADEVEARISAGIDPGNIAIIYRKHTDSDRIISEFKRRKIPYSTRRATDILNEPLILQLEDYLAYIAGELDTPHSEEARLYRLLHYGLCACAPNEAARMAVEVRRQKTSWREYLATCKATGDSGLPGITRFRDDLEYWLSHASDFTTPELTERIIAKAGFLRKAMEHENPGFAMALLHSYHELIQRENKANPMLTLQELLQRTNKRRRASLSVNIEKRYGEENGVVFTTAHNSKGLEWDTVFIVGCNANNWEGIRSRSLPFKLAEVLGSLPESAETDEEEIRRLFYVAMTRAKRKLVMTWQQYNFEGKELMVSSLAMAAVDAEKASSKTAQIEAPRLLESEAGAFSAGETAGFGMPGRAYIADRIASFVLSPTAMQNYLTCPVAFYYQNILQVPRSRSEHASFGSAIHDTLNACFIDFKRSGRLPETSDLLDKFKHHMYRYRDGFTRDGFQRRMVQGQDILPGYYAQRKDTFSTENQVLLEYRIDTRLNEIPIAGKLDKVVINGNSARVCDYKTGKPERGKDKLKALKTDDTGNWLSWGEYWLQLAFYRILSENHQEVPWRAEEFEIDFVQPDTAGVSPVHRIRFTPDEIAQVKIRIAETDRAIRNLEFDKGCGKNECEWCNFAKYYDIRHYAPENQDTDELQEP
jgi:DNA helicase II / ATP-dependent DNA helicase PcrA